MGYNYLISDIHGNLEAFKSLLAKAKFGKNDNLYIVGGIVDYGPDSIGLLQDLMVRENVFSIMGSHEFNLLCFLKNMQKKEEGKELSKKAAETMTSWFANGGAETAKKVMELSSDDKEALSDYLEDMEVYLELEIDDRLYLCLPSGIKDYDPDMELDEYDYSNLIDADESDTDIEIEGTIVVTGKNPNRDASGLPTGQIFVGDTHIKLDCGAAQDGRLGMYCVETGECIYVEL